MCLHSITWRALSKIHKDHKEHHVCSGQELPSHGFESCRRGTADTHCSSPGALCHGVEQLIMEYTMTTWTSFLFLPRASLDSSKPTGHQQTEPLTPSIFSTTSMMHFKMQFSSFITTKRVQLHFTQITQSFTCLFLSLSTSLASLGVVRARKRCKRIGPYHGKSRRDSVSRAEQGAPHSKMSPEI